MFCLLWGRSWCINYKFKKSEKQIFISFSLHSLWWQYAWSRLCGNISYLLYMELFLFLSPKNNLKKYRKGNCKFGKTSKARLPGLPFVTWLHIVIFIGITGIILVLVCASCSTNNRRENRKESPPKKDSLTNSTQSKIRYCPKLLLLYIYLKRLNFKLKVSLIFNYPFYKVNLPTSIFAGIKIQVKSSLSSLHWYDLFFHFKKEWKLNSKVSTYLHLLIYS